MYRVMIWVQYGLITIPTTLIIRSCMSGLRIYRDIPIREATLLSLNLRMIEKKTFKIGKWCQT